MSAYYNSLATLLLTGDTVQGALNLIFTVVNYNVLLIKTPLQQFYNYKQKYLFNVKLKFRITSLTISRKQS